MSSTNVNPYRKAEEVYSSFYPREISNARCKKYTDGSLVRPYEALEQSLKDTSKSRSEIKPGKAVLFWFKRDLRLFDNRGLHAASNLAEQRKIPLICIFIASPQDYQAHLTSIARIDFEFRTLKILKDDLSNLNIPLIVHVQQDRTNLPDFLLNVCSELGINHVFCNIEYEVDELRREASLVERALENGIDFSAIHDDVVVVPRLLWKGQGKQVSVFSPWHRSWIRYLETHPESLQASHIPHANAIEHRQTFSKYFDTNLPDAPLISSEDEEYLQRIRKIWPAGEHEARRRLAKFLDDRATRYADERNDPSANSTAVLSVHHSVGTLTARMSVRTAIAHTGQTNIGNVGGGHLKWISELAWRDFYKYIMVYWPYVCMNKAFKFETSNIKWETNEDHFEAWCEARTGFPIIDASMRQLLQTGYMHNRCRMVVAAFLAKDLLIDWRRGERFFMTRLIDGDFASNNGGWGFSANVGVDPQPFLRLFNPLLQSSKFDEHGRYIKKWLPELSEIPDVAVHDPYGRGYGHVAAKNGYPEPIVDHKECRVRAIERYQAGQSDDRYGISELISPRKPKFS